MDAVGDLQYVRDAVQRADRRMIPGIAVLWAVAMLVGAVLADVRPAAVGLYWLIAAPIGFLVSCVMGFRASRRAGQVSSEHGTRQMLHWGSLLGCGMLGTSWCRWAR